MAHETEGAFNARVDEATARMENTPQTVQDDFRTAVKAYAAAVVFTGGTGGGLAHDHSRDISDQDAQAFLDQLINQLRYMDGVLN